MSHGRIWHSSCSLLPKDFWEAIPLEQTLHRTFENGGWFSENIVGLQVVMAMGGKYRFSSRMPRY